IINAHADVRGCRRLNEDQPVGADASASIADATRKSGRILYLRTGALIDDGEVVERAVHLRHGHAGHYEVVTSAASGGAAAGASPGVENGPCGEMVETACL